MLSSSPVTAAALIRHCCGDATPAWPRAAPYHAKTWSRFCLQTQIMTVSPAILAAMPATGQRTDSPGIALLHPSDLSSADRVQWRELLAERPQSAPFIDEAWVTAWCAAYRPLEPLFVCARHGDGRLVGLGALQGLIESWAGQRIRVLQSLTNVESVRYEFVATSTPPDIHERLWRALCDARRWDVIRVEYLPEDSPSLSAGIRVAEDLGWTHFREMTFESPWRSLPRLGTSWDEGLKRKFKANLRNRERRLRTLGEVTFSVVRAGAEQPAALDAFYALEAGSWKGERGTAIAQRPSVKAFYDGLVDRTAQDIWIAVLSVAGRPAAAQFVRLADRTLLLLKTAYDPAFAPYAPGQLLTARLIQYGIDQGMEVLDFLAANMTWKRDWEPQLRGHYCLQLFAPSARGRYAYWSRYGIREHARRIPGLTSLVRWLRAR